jgi:hypothetical protein
VILEATTDSQTVFLLNLATMRRMLFLVLRYTGDESSSVFFGPQLRLLCGDSGAVEFDQSGLPFVYQLRSLTRAALGTGKHPLHMEALLCRLVWLAGGMIGHMILMHNTRGETYNRILYKLG